jgi:hypothetical protein
VFEYYDFCTGKCPKTQQSCYLFFCRQKEFGEKRFYLTIWQKDRQVAKERANCCLDLLSFIYRDKLQQNLGGVEPFTVRMKTLIDKWGHRELVNALVILKLNELIDLQPCL